MPDSRQETSLWKLAAARCVAEQREKDIGEPVIVELRKREWDFHVVKVHFRRGSSVVILEVKGQRKGPARVR